MADSITWYDVLGISPGASFETVQNSYLQKSRQLSQVQATGASADVLDAVSHGQEAIDLAWRVLGDSGEREQYDDEIYASRKKTGLPAPSLPSAERRPLISGFYPLAALLDAADMVAEWLSLENYRPSRKKNSVLVPDVKGFFFNQCLSILAKVNLNVKVIRLTDRPSPVEGFVCDQSPKPGSTARRHDTVTVMVWHPPQ